jgi:hypothetical protein
MRERAGGVNTLELKRDGIGFKGANPNGQEASAAFFLQNNNAMLGHQTDTDTINRYFNHVGSISCSALALGVTCQVIACLPAV